MASDQGVEGGGGKGAVFLRPQDLSLISSLPNSKEGVLSQHDLLTRLMVWVAIWGKS